MPVAIEEPDDRRVHGRRQIPGRLQIGHGVHSAENPGESFGGEETCIAATHDNDVVNQPPQIPDKDGGVVDAV